MYTSEKLQEVVLTLLSLHYNLFSEDDIERDCATTTHFQDQIVVQKNSLLSLSHTCFDGFETNLSLDKLLQQMDFSELPKNSLLPLLDNHQDKILPFPYRNRVHKDKVWR